MAVDTETVGVITPPVSEDERREIDQLDRILAAALDAGGQAGDSTALLALVGPDGSHVSIPTSVYRILSNVVHHMAHGEAVSLIPRHKELTTQQAAEILNVSRPYLVRLLDRGDIPSKKVGTHRRVKLADVLAYREQRARSRWQAVDKLANLSQELGKY